MWHYNEGLSKDHDRSFWENIAVECYIAGYNDEQFNEQKRNANIWSFGGEL